MSAVFLPAGKIGLLTLAATLVTLFVLVLATATTYTVYVLLGGVMVRVSDLRSSGRGFDSRSDRYRAT